MSTQLHRSALVLHSAQQMYDLVNDLETYPEFLPWCQGAEILLTEGDELEAALVVAKGGIRQRFTTRNRLEAGRSIQMQLLDGPFSRLQGRWSFQPLAETACKVCFELEFEFSSRLLAMTVGPIFNHAANTMVDAFCQRAKEIYGRSK